MQLDVKTKLCIRDSLYRLAKSAEQRHNDADASGQVGDDVEACKGIMTQDANRYCLLYSFIVQIYISRDY